MSSRGGDLEEVLAKHNSRQWQDILSEFNKVSAWIDKNFASVEFRIEFNEDRKPSGDLLRIKLRWMTGKDMDDDQLLYKHELVLTPEMFDDPNLMGKFTQNIYPSFTNLTKAMVNTWYKRKQERLGKEV